MATGCATTAFLGLRGDSRARRTASVAASAAASVAVLDAWFDITTAPAGAQLAQAVGCAVLAGSLAGGCVYLARSRRVLAPR